MEKYPYDLRKQLMEKDTSIRAVIACPAGGHIVTLGFPGLEFDFAGRAFINPERLEATLSAPALGTCRLLVVLVETDEVPADAWPLLAQAAERQSIRLVHLPIKDYEAPDECFMQSWMDLAADMAGIFTDEATVALSCHYGAGRSGTIAAGMLIAQGLSADQAIATVRAEFADSIESEKQLAWLKER